MHQLGRVEAQRRIHVVPAKRHGRPPGAHPVLILVEIFLAILITSSFNENEVLGGSDKEKVFKIQNSIFFHIFVDLLHIPFQLCEISLKGIP